MLYISTMIAGGCVGGFVAYRRKGNGFDIAQYVGVFAIIGFLLGIVSTIILARIYGA